MSSEASPDHSPVDHATCEPEFGVAFEAENGEADIERWRHASPAERSAVIAEVIEHAERVAAATGIRNEEPAPRFPLAARRERSD